MAQNKKIQCITPPPMYLAQKKGKQMEKKKNPKLLPLRWYKVFSLPSTWHGIQSIVLLTMSIGVFSHFLATFMWMGAWDQFLLIPSFLPIFSSIFCQGLKREHSTNWRTFNKLLSCSTYCLSSSLNKQHYMTLHSISLVWSLF